MKANINLGPIWDGSKNKDSFFTRIFKKKASKFLYTPKIIKQKCNGLQLGKSCAKSLLFSTDMALIENNDSDAILAVYPFAPSPKIMESLIKFTKKPVVCGIGGGLTQGKVALEMALIAEGVGASAIIFNQPLKNKCIETIKRKINVPLISSVSTINFSFKDRVNAGVDMFHITGGEKTCLVLEYVDEILPGYPVMATGGKTLGNINQSIESGADAIVLTPPASGDLFKSIMNQYRKGINKIK